MNASHRRILATLIWLAAAPWLLFPTISPALSALAAGALLLVLALIWTPGSALPRTAVDGLLAVYLALVAVAFLVTPLPDVSLPKLLVILLGAVGFYVTTAWLDRGLAAVHLTTLLAGAGAAVAVVGALAMEWPVRQIINLRPITDQLPHLTGDFYIHHNEVAGALLPLLPFALATWLGNGQATRRRRALGLAASLLIIAGLLLTQSRNALLGLGVAAIAWQLWGRWRLRSALITAGVLLALGLAVLVVPALRDQVGRPLAEWLATVDVASKSGNSEAPSWATRLEIWTVAGEMLRDYPAVGAGLYTFDPVSRANYAYDLIGPEFFMAHAHNLFLQTGASLGWPGLATMIALWTVTVAGLWRAGYKAGGTGRLAAVYGAAVVAYLSFNMVDALTLGQKPGVLIWLMLAGATAVGGIPSAPRAHQRWEARFVRLALPAGALLLLLALLLTPAAGQNRAALALDRLRLSAGRPGDARLAGAPGAFAGDTRRQALLALWQGDEAAAGAAWARDPGAALFLQSQGRLAEQAGDLAGARAWYERSLAIDPQDGRTYFYLGRVYERQGALAEAEANYETAAAYVLRDGLSPEWRARTIFSWGRMRMAQNDWETAANAFLQAVAWQPLSPFYFEGLGDVLQALGDEAGAAAAYRRAENLR